MALEIEKKFLLKNLPDMQFDEALEIEQFYGPTGRLRKIVSSDGVSYIRTIKKSVSKGVNEEFETEITKKQFDKEVKHYTRKLTKQRFIKKIGKLKWEFDYFNEIRLIMAEVEVPTKKDLKMVKVPKKVKLVLISDVTGNKDFSNFNIAEPR